LAAQGRQPVGALEELARRFRDDCDFEATADLFERFLTAATADAEHVRSESTTIVQAHRQRLTISLDPSG